MRIILIAIFCITLISSTTCVAQHDTRHRLEFRPASDMLYERYGNNSKEIDTIRQFLSDNEDVIVSARGHVRLVAPVAGIENNPADMNLAALRAAVIRTYFRQNFRMFTNWNFTFYFDDTRAANNMIEVSYIPHSIPFEVSSEMYYTQDKNSLAKAQQYLSKYEKLPYLSEAPRFEDSATTRTYFERLNAIATNPVNVSPKEDESDQGKTLIAIHYRWDQYNLDSLYLSNPGNLYLLDYILTSHNSMCIDTLTIVAYASPEGHPDYNKRLSERRARTIKDYIINNYKSINPSRIITQARGENWQGLRNLVVNDRELPLRGEVLRIIDSPLSDLEKQSRLVQLDSGKIYYRYILPNYYRYLRNGSSLLITYAPNAPKYPETIVVHEPETKQDIEPETELNTEPKRQSDSAVIMRPEFAPEYRHIRPIALKTNMLFDLASLFNIELEVPIGTHFSVLAEWTFPWWGGLGNRGGVSPVPVYSERYTLEMLSGGIEFRYWFNRSVRLNERAQKWGDHNPLCGWFVGPYVGRGLYDFQLGRDGVQGDFYIAAGISGGYAHPIGKYFHMEYSLGIGYLKTEYKHYTPMDGHKVYQYDGRYTWLGPTKAKISLVWMPRFKVNDKKGGTK